MAGISYFITIDYPRFILQESRRIRWGATLVAITGIVNEPILASLLRVRESGRRVVLIVLSKNPAPSLPAILTYHLPIADEEPEEDTVVDDEAETARQRYLRRRAEQEAQRKEPVAEQSEDR